MSEMSRGEMIRRLDEAARDVHDHLANGPLTADERHALAASLTWLLPTVADTLQDQADEEAVRALVSHGAEPGRSARPGKGQTPPPTVTVHAFHAEKPVLTTHPVNGGDALMFTITPPPPQRWWRALRQHAGASPALIRPWDQEHDDRIAVECPALDKLADVIAAIDTAVAEANADHARELALQRDAATQLKTDQARRKRHRRDIQRALDEHYGATPSL